MEIGIPVTRPIGNVPSLDDAREGELGSSDLPGGEAAVTMHVGPYDGLTRTYERLHDWIHAQGRDEGPGPWESYLDDPAEVDDPAELRTEVTWPLR
jgi:effector-binding domain-containing protein